MMYFNIKFCGHMKNVQLVWVCPASRAATSGHGIILYSQRTGGSGPSQQQCLGWNRREHCRGPLPAIIIILLLLFLVGAQGSVVG
jgi:hypothetical protein